MCNVKVFLKGLVIAAVVGMLCAWALATERPTEQTPGAPAQQRPQMQQRPGMPQPRSQADQAMMLQRSSELIGKEIQSRQGKNLGNIYDLVLTPDLQQVSYVALAHGGVWGVGAKLFAIPCQALEIGPENKIIVSITEQQLETAAGFDEDNWPAWGNPRWAMGAMRQGQTYERETTPGQMGRTATEPGPRPEMERQQQPGQMAEREPMAQQDRDRSRGMSAMREEAWSRGMAGGREVQQRRVTHLTGMDVKNDEGEDIGNIEDFVIDMSEGRLAYAVVSFGGFWGIGEKYAAVPYSAIELQTRRNVARLDADRQTLESIAFEPGQFPDLANREYANRIHETFDVEPYWIVFGFIPAEEQQAAAERTWGSESQFAKQFDADKIKTMQATVQSIGTFQPEGAAPGTADGLRLRVKTDDGKLATIYAGPRWYARQQNFYLMPGDRITVTGSDTKVGWRSVIMATELKKDDKTLQLRDKTGQPQWKWQPQGRQMPQRQPGQQGQSRQPGAAGQRPQQPGQTRQ